MAERAPARWTLRASAIQSDGFGANAPRIERRGVVGVALTVTAACLQCAHSRPPGPPRAPEAPPARLAVASDAGADPNLPAARGAAIARLEQLVARLGPAPAADEVRADPIAAPGSATPNSFGPRASLNSKPGRRQGQRVMSARGETSGEQGGVCLQLRWPQESRSCAWSTVQCD